MTELKIHEIVTETDVADRVDEFWMNIYSTGGSGILWRSAQDAQGAVQTPDYLFTIHYVRKLRTPKWSLGVKNGNAVLLHNGMLHTTIMTANGNRHPLPTEAIQMLKLDVEDMSNCVRPYPLYSALRKLGFTAKSEFGRKDAN